MATPRLSRNTTLSSSINERRQVEARIRALQLRTNALYEELSHSSSVATTAIHDIEQAYAAIVNEYQGQRDQLVKRVQHVKRNIRESASELGGIRRSLYTARSFHLPHSSPRYSNNLEVHEMNIVVDDIERVLNQIGQQLKKFRFIPSTGPALSKKLGTIRAESVHRQETSLPSFRSFVDQDNLTPALCAHKLYTIHIDIAAKWVVSTIDKRIFLCDREGEVRIFSYSREFRRQPLLTERFHLSNARLISSFTATQDYLIAFEKDTQILTLYTHHGALLLRLYFPYEPIMLSRCDYKKKNQIWICSSTKRQCFQFSINHSTKKVNQLDKIDFTHPVSNVLIDPIGISCDEQERIAVHDVNPSTGDRLILYTNTQNKVILLDFVKYLDRVLSSHIKHVLLVPKQPNIIVVVYAPELPSSATLNEVVVVDIGSQKPQILHCFSEPNGIKGIDVTLNGELVYTVTTPANKRMPPKLNIYGIIH